MASVGRETLLRSHERQETVTVIAPVFPTEPFVVVNPVLGVVDLVVLRRIVHPHRANQMLFFVRFGGIGRQHQQARTGHGNVLVERGQLPAAQVEIAERLESQLDAAFVFDGRAHGGRIARRHGRGPC